MSKVIRYLKIVLFYLLLGIILIIYLNNRLWGIYLGSFAFVIYLISFLVSLSAKKRLLKTIQAYPVISDKEISNKLERPIEDVRNVLFSLSKNQKKKKWLVVFLNNRYIFLNEKAVENFIELHQMGYNEKKILENLQRSTRIRSRAEVKAIELTLANQNRLDKE